MELQTGIIPDISESYAGSLRLNPPPHLKDIGASPPVWIEAIATEQLPTAFSLVGSLPAPEDQALRGTCASFAGSLAAQFLAQRDLSEQHLYNVAWHLENAPTNTSEGISMEAVFAALMQGVCDGPIWPYEPFPKPGNLPQDPPPSVVSSADKFRIANWSSLPLPSSDRAAFVARCLFAGKGPVVLSLPTFWNGTSGWEEGFFIDVPPGDPPLGGWHAIAAVGYNLAERFIIVQNSWGPDWGVAGLGLISFGYIDRYVRSAYVAQGNGQ